MKINLKPGISPAFFWTTMGVSAGGVVVTGLSMTAYTWVPLVIGALTLIISFVKANGPKGPDA